MVMWKIVILLQKLNLNKYIKKENNDDVKNCGSFKGFGFIYIYRLVFSLLLTL